MLASPLTVPPAVDVTSHEVLSYSGDEVVEIECKVSGLPKPDISWYKLDGKLPENAVVNEEGNLILKNVSIDNTGVYKCVGKNELGTSEGLAEVRIQGKQAACLDNHFAKQRFHSFL